MAGLFSFLICLWGILFLPGLGLLIAGKVKSKRGLKIAGWIICAAMLTLLLASFACAVLLIE